ncbi:hypothetical protein V6N11_017693 [Hibiscus sabdariffa]|uniref:RNase H type-1 domain-containing protein n=1 Tax=Hibiscus sabdariffa TaxID=183260 RepID=A0ABR2TYR6_9ROSI
MEEISSMDHGNLNVVVDAAAKPGDLNKSSGASKPTFRDMVTGGGTSDRQKEALSEFDVEVVHRRRKISPLAKDATGTRSTTGQGIHISGSRFTALQQVDDEFVSEGIGQDGSRSRGKAVVVEKAEMAKEIPFAPKTAESSWQGANRVEGELVSHSQELEESLSMDLNMGVMRKSAEVASSEVVIPVKSTLDQSKHQAVKVVDKGMNRTIHENNGRILPVSIRGGSPAMNSKNNSMSKGISKKGINTKKKSTNLPPKPVLAEFVSAMTTELNRASNTRDTTGVVQQNELIEGTNQVHWRDNSSFLSTGNVEKQKAPQEGWIKINTDAVVAGSDRLAIIGGVFRDHTGKWIFGFSRKVGVSTVLIAELWAIHDALQRAWDRGLRKINLESDCLDAVRILNGKSTSLLGNGLVATIFKLLRYDWTVSISHINRACNGVVDRLGTLSKANNIDDLQLLEPPAEVLSLMQMEAIDFCNL